MATIHRIDQIKLEENLENLYDTGYQKLDSLLKGLKAGTVITVGARPAMGKTNFVNNIVIRLLKNYNLPSLYLSLSASKEITLTKLAAIDVHKPYIDIKDKPRSYIDEFISKQYHLYLSDDCFNIQELESVIEENRNIRLLVIDYIQLMKSDREFISATDFYNDVINRIRVLANKYKLIIILISQLSRQVEYREDKRPLSVDLRNSGSLENDSDVIILLYQASYYNKNDKDMLEVIVSKNRYGLTGCSYFEYDEQSTLIEY